MRKLAFIFISVITLVACNKDQDTSIIYGYQYFPVDTGKYVVYDVIDILHDDISGVHDTDYYQIKEVMGEEDIDLEGEPFHKLYRYKRESDTLLWQLKDVWVVKKSNSSVEVVEENKRVIRMAFSISYDQYWDCNAFNSDDPEQCYYRDIYKPKLVGTINYDSTVVVESNDFLSFIEYKRSYDVYAANVGRIQMVYKDLEIDNEDTLDVQKGVELYYTAIDFGG
ncbi:MAG: hypothetical protein HUJ25_07410 [Crocinitomicaceae bacterium]|nr:hypothetical protein [Crocinitomicaceae bacterium]